MEEIYERERERRVYSVEGFSYFFLKKKKKKKGKLKSVGKGPARGSKIYVFFYA